MATLVVVLLCSKILFQSFPVIQATTHWIVTEDGRIQAQMDSVFTLRRPYDLVTLLRQEERAVMLEHLTQELLMRKEEIDKNEDKDTGLEQRFYKINSDCLSAGRPLPDFDLYISTVLPLENKGIRPEEHIDPKASVSSSPKAPFCTEVMDLEYSIHAFEHLEGMKDRENLTGSPELGLKNAITHRDNVDDYGHLIYEALKKNKTSWVLYNMAAFYWRIKGNPYQVVECLRRALHFSPRMQKDVALISLANVLHRSRFSNEAAIVVHAALDVSKELNVNHFTLGNIYAVLAEYNKSVICFENTLKIQPDFEAAAKRKHAVLCYAGLESALENQHKSLQRTLSELRDYQRMHAYWQEQKDKLDSVQVLSDTRFDQRVAWEQHRLRLSIVTIGDFCHMVLQNGQQALQCSWGRRQPTQHHLDYGWTAHDQPNSSQDEIPLRADPSIDYSKPLREPLYPRKKKANSSEKGQPDLAYKDKDWPTKDECDTYVQKFPSFTEFPTTYLPPENKGFEVKPILGEAQGLSKLMQHALPWYPPVCISIADVPVGTSAYDHIQSVVDRSKIPARLSDSSLTHILLELVDGNDVTEAEVGQRILTALKREIGPKWVLFNLAGLYWRINGNNFHGIECLRRAIHFAPPEYRDIPLLNLANILYKWGRVDDAVTVMRDAVIINDVEPETHFFLANVLAAKTNITGAIWHYKEALNQEPTHQGAFSMLRTVMCYNKFHRSAQSAAPKETVTVLNSPSCQKGIQLKQPMESRVVCKNENGQETCVVETQTVGANCGSGGCKQTCTVTPIRVESDKNCPTHTFSERSEGKNCDNSANPGAATNPVMMDPDISIRLDEISEYFRQKGACNGEECHRLMVQCFTPMRMEFGYVQALLQQQFVYMPSRVHLSSCIPPPNINQQQRQHTQLEIINGVLHQKLIFVESPTDILVKSTDCVIFNDGSKTLGCSREEFKPYNINQRPHTQLEIINGLLRQKLIFVESPTDIPVKSTDCVIFNDGSKTSGCSREEFMPYALDDYQKFTDIFLANIEEPCNHDNKEPANANTKEPEVVSADISGLTSLNLHDVIDDIDEEIGEYTEDDSEDISVEPLTFSDEDILKFNPDPARHIQTQAEIAWPTAAQCQEKKYKINFSQFLSTWVSVSTKGEDVRTIIDHEALLRGKLIEPECVVSSSEKAAILDVLPGIKVLGKLYQPELGLQETLKKLGQEPEPVAVVGARIALALQASPSSWALADLAALYWRVEGDAENALRCIKVAYVNAPRHARDITLLSLANILHQTGLFEDALLVTNMALEASPKLVALHFTVANLYAAKEDWLRAQQFYRSTLGLQSAFQPALERLQAIRCLNTSTNK